MQTISESKINNSINNDNETAQADVSENYEYTIVPDNVNFFNFSKKQHYDFFKKNYFDFDIFDSSISLTEFTIVHYQNFLVYFLMQKYAREGSKILVVGDSGKPIYENQKLKEYYDFWMLKDSNELSKNTFGSNQDISVLKCGEDKTVKNPLNYFDFIFAISSFDNIPPESSVEIYKNIIYNLSKLARNQAYISVNFTVNAVGKKIKLSQLCYQFFKDHFGMLPSVMNYTEPANLLEDKELFFEETDFARSDFPGENKIKTAKKFSYNILLRKVKARLPVISKTTTKDFRQKTPGYFFHHLIKCGGSSLGSVLSNWFNFQNDVYDEIDGITYYSGNINEFLKFKYNLENLNSDDCIRGHYQHAGIHIHRRYPEIFGRDDIKVFTFIRDPLKVLISLYYFGRKREYDYLGLKLKDYLKTTHNFLAYILPCNEENYKEVLDRYFFIGIVDRMQESFDKLADKLEKKRVKVPLYNTTEKDSQVKELTPDMIEEVKERNRLDYMIYNYCIEKFNKS